MYNYVFLLASRTLQKNEIKFQSWAKLWNIRISSDKSAQLTFTERRASCHPPIFLDGIPITK